MVQAYHFVGLLELDASRAQNTLRQFTSQLRGLKILGTEISTIFKGAGFYLMAKRFVRMAEEASRFAKEMDVVARKLGMSSQSLVSMKNAFESIGAKGKNIEQVFNKIHQGMQAFKYGDGKFVSQLAAMGVSAFDSTGGRKSDKQILFAIMDAARSMRQSGRSQQDVADWLQKTVGAEYQIAEKMMMGAEAFKQWQEQVERETGVVDQRQLNNLTELNDSFSKFGVTIKNLTNQFLGDLSPAIKWVTDLFQFFMRELQYWWEAVADMFHAIFGEKEEWQTALKAIKEVFRYFGLLSEVMITVVTVILKVIRWLSESVGRIIAWLVNKFSWIFGDKKPSMDEHKQKLANDLALQVMEGKRTPEEAAKLSQQMGLPEPDYMFDVGSTEDVVRAESYDGRSSITVYAETKVNVDKNGDVITDTSTSAESGGSAMAVNNVTKTQ